LPPHEIGFVNAMLDDHEGMVVVRTEDPEVGKMEYWVAPDMTDEFKAFVVFVRNDLKIPMEIHDPIPESTEITEYKSQRITPGVPPS